jgi:hypothetical protein
MLVKLFMIRHRHTLEFGFREGENRTEQSFVEEN